MKVFIQFWIVVSESSGAGRKLPDVFRFVSNRETDQNEGLADDNTTITILDIECLSRIKKCINDFSSISGLLCSFEKSVLVPINQPAQEDLLALRDLGFVVTDSFKLLGLTIKPSLDNNVEIYEEILNKIRGLILFWECFRLSLPRRLAIMKTYLISQFFRFSESRVSYHIGVTYILT